MAAGTPPVPPPATTTSYEPHSGSGSSFDAKRGEGARSNESLAAASRSPGAHVSSRASHSAAAISGYVPPPSGIENEQRHAIPVVDVFGIGNLSSSRVAETPSRGGILPAATTTREHFTSPIDAQSGAAGTPTTRRARTTRRPDLLTSSTPSGVPSALRNTLRTGLSVMNDAPASKSSASRTRFTFSGVGIETVRSAPARWNHILLTSWRDAAGSWRTTRFAPPISSSTPATKETASASPR